MSNPRKLLGSTNCKFFHIIYHIDRKLNKNKIELLFTEDVDSPVRGGETRRTETPQPYPLPMPAYGGYFAPLTYYLPENLPPTPGFHR